MWKKQKNIKNTGFFIKRTKSVQVEMYNRSREGKDNCIDKTFVGKGETRCQMNGQGTTG